jgi:hypothetical protein
MGTTRDVQDAVQAELAFDPVIDPSGIVVMRNRFATRIDHSLLISDD